MTRRVQVIEGEHIRGLSPEEAQLVRSRLTELKDLLKPRRKFLAGDVAPRVQNLVGSVQVTPDLILDVAPKTRPGTDWAGALVDLLSPATRVELGGDSDNAEQRAVRVLPDAFAAHYAEKLDRAVRREGPLTLIVPQYASRPALSGRLDVTSWVTGRIVKPAHFPQYENSLTADNSFSSAMAYVAYVLARRTTDPRVAAKLRATAARLRPGFNPPTSVDPGVALRDIPPQWRAYGPPWSLARAFLRRVAPLHRDGALDGLGLALEPWPLLETLLERSLMSAAEMAIKEGFGGVEGHGHSGKYRVRSKVGETPSGVGFHKNGAVDPDGMLTVGGLPFATFEAKYTSPTSEKIRTHSFQALTTAAAVGAPISVLVYPTSFKPIAWDIHGFHERPAKLVAVGLDLFGYRSGSGDTARAEVLLDIVRSVLPAG